MLRPVSLPRVGALLVGAGPLVGAAPLAGAAAAAVLGALAFGGCEPRYPPDEQPVLQVGVPERTAEAGGALPVDVEVLNFDLAAPADDLPFVVGQGHLHVFFDEERDLRMATVGGQRVLVPLEEPAGAKKLVFRLHHNDHSPVDGVPDRAFDVVVVDPPLSFVVQRVLGPARPGTDASAELTVAGFAFDLDRYEVEDVVRHGHGHVRFVQGDLDVDLGPFFDGKPRFVVPQDAALGPATLVFVLHTNTHGPLDPPFSVEVAVDVEDAASTP